MAKIKLKDFQTKIRLRNLKMEDFDALVAMQEQCFPGMKPWRREQIESQLKIFPEGQFVIEYENEIVASSASLIVDFGDYEEWQNFKAISDGGFIRNHDPDGDTLYGIEVMVDPEYRGLKLSRRLYDARKQLIRERNLSRMIIGGRIPGYHKYAKRMTAREYVEKVVAKSLYDPVLTPQLANGFVLQGLIPNYLPSDTDSCGYATYLEWINLDHSPDPIRRFRSVSLVRVCLVQYELRPIRSFDDFAKQSEFFADVASDYKSDFVVFPELFTTQLLSIVKPQRPGLAARSLSEFTPQYLELFRDMAIKYNVNIVGGSHFSVENDDLFNISYLFRRDGTLAKQYKLHVTPNERKWWGIKPGDRMNVFATDRGRIAIQVCYDIEFPELSRIAAARGAGVIFVPFNTDERHGYLRVQQCARARSIENHMYVATAGCVGNLPFVENADIHYAQSGIYTPSDFAFARDGVAAETTPNIETVVIHDIDLDLLARTRRSGTVCTWEDRRCDLYRVRFREGDEYHEI
jgi:predicted amidohydrolase/GNAT superfamily N-acetyltransferase